MPTRSNVICRLNANYRRALSGRFVEFGGSIYDKKLKGRYDYDTGLITEIGRGEVTCCGIDELDFQILNENWKESDFPKNLSRKDWENLIALYIKGTVETQDERILIVGIPVKVGQSSMYDIEFYKRLRITLNEFGFRELCKPYRNRNSGNTIVVLAGQIPE